MIDLNVMPIFVAVVEQGSFSAAAETLGISKAAVSKRITKLEADLGVRLLNRTTRSLHLTEPGTQYFKHAQKIVASAQKAVATAIDLQSKPKGLLRVSLPMSLGRIHIAPLLAEFLHLHPEITVELHLNDAWSDLISGGYDIAIRMAPLPDSEFMAKKFVTLNSLLCASPHYIKHHGMPTQPQDLTQHNCLLFSHHTIIHEWAFRHHHTTTKVTVQGNLEVNNSEVLKTAAIDGLGIARLPTFAVIDALNKKELVQILPDHHMLQRDAYWLFPMKTYIPEKVRAFVDFITEKTATLPIW